MTLDEVIEDFRYDAEQNMVDLDVSFAKRNNQIADWLEELKSIKEEIGTDEWIREHDRLIRNKAIDDFVNAINQISYVPACVDCLSKQQIKDIAKRLKNKYAK